MFWSTSELNITLLLYGDIFSGATKTKHSARKFCVFEAAKHPLSLQCFVLHGFSLSLVETQSSCLVSVWKGWVGTLVSLDRVVPVQDSWVYCWGYESPKLRPVLCFLLRELGHWLSGWKNSFLTVSSQAFCGQKGESICLKVWSCSSQPLSCGFSGTSHIFKNHSGVGRGC